MKKNAIQISCICLLLFSAVNIHAQKITTIAGNGVTGYSGDNGPATAAQFDYPSGVVLDNKGNIFIADYINDRVRKVNAAGIVTTIAGIGVGGFTGDGGPATAAQINGPISVAVDKIGNVYFAEYLNERIRKIDTFGIITTIAGNGTGGYDGDGVATAKQLNKPWGVAVDSAGNVYIADEFNDRIRKVNTAGILTTIAGNGINGFGGDGGTATAASFDHPTSIAFDKSGNMYVADAGNFRIRKISPSGIVSSICGDGTSASTGDGGPASAARLKNVIGVAFDTTFNLFVCDGNRIRKINFLTMTITSVAGNGTSGYSGDGGPATAAAINAIFGSVAVGSNGNIYIADSENRRVRKVNVAATALGSPARKEDMMNVYPNPAFDELMVGFSSAGSRTTISIVDMSGRAMWSRQNIVEPTISIDTRELDPGMYFIIAAIDGYVYCKQVIIAR